MPGTQILPKPGFKKKIKVGLPNSNKTVSMHNVSQYNINAQYARPTISHENLYFFQEENYAF